MDWLLAALGGAVIGWAANHFLPGVWRSITRTPPIQVFVEVDPAIIWAGSPPWLGASYVVPNLRGLGKPPSSFCPEWHGWLRDRGAVPGAEMEIEVTLSASTEVTVVIDGVRAKVVRKRERPSWIHLLCAVGGADLIPRHVSIDLDGFDPPATVFRDHDLNPTEWPRLSLSKGEVEKLSLRATANTHDIEWKAEILAIVDGKRRTFTIDENGNPFRTCATEGLPRHMWTGVEWEPPLPTG